MDMARLPVLIKGSLFLILALGLVGCGDGGELIAGSTIGSNTSEANSPSESGEPFSLGTRLILAVMKQDISAVQQLLDQGAKPDNTLGLFLNDQ